MFFLVHRLVRITFLLAIIYPFDFIFVRLAIFHNNRLYDIFTHIERNVIYNIMYGRITFTDTGQFLSVQIHFRRTDI